jgi:hypothetical protein
VYVSKSQGSNVKVHYSKFENNGGVAIFMYNHGLCVYKHSKYHNDIHSVFVNNTVTGPRKVSSGLLVGTSLIFLDALVTVSLSKFSHNRASLAIVHVPYYHHTAAENFTKNFFSDNRAGFEVYVSPNCESGLIISLSSTPKHCIQCPESWFRDLIGIVLAASIAGIALVIFMLYSS